MNTSVDMKERKKQSSLSGSLSGPLPESLAISATDRELEHSLLSLENTCLRILESQSVNGRQDTEQRYWQQRFKNIVTPVSLALVECKGPRRFHYHYKHRADDASVLHPVLSPPLDTLAQVCKMALKACHSELVGIEDDVMIRMRDMLETALGNFLLRHKKV